MQVLSSLVLFGCFVLAAFADAQSASVCRIRKLILTSSDLPPVERHAIIRAFQGRTYNTYFLAQFIQSKLRDSGYARAEVSAPQTMRLKSALPTCEAAVGYSVLAGSQYYLSEITFHVSPGKPVFTSAQFRAQFPISNGAIFSAQRMGAGLDKLRELYFSAGYANFGAVPTLIYDESRRTVAININIDQGRLVRFGRLLMEGVEPRAGVAQQLLAAWSELEGKPYSPKLLKDWLKRNSASWPGKAAAQTRITYIGGSATECNVLLDFQTEQSESVSDE